MIQAEKYLKVTNPCDLCGRKFDEHELQCQSRTGNHLCSECMEEQENCGCADD